MVGKVMKRRAKPRGRRAGKGGGGARFETGRPRFPQPGGDTFEPWQQGGRDGTFNPSFDGAPPGDRMMPPGSDLRIPPGVGPKGKGPGPGRVRPLQPQPGQQKDISRFMNKVRGADIWGGPGMSGTAPAMANYFRTNPADKQAAAKIYGSTRGQDFFSRFSGAGSVGNQILEALPGAKNAYLGSMGHELVDANGDGTMDRVLPIGSRTSGASRPGVRPGPGASPMTGLPQSLLDLLAQYGYGGSI